MLRPIQLAISCLSLSLAVLEATSHEFGNSRLGSGQIVAIQQQPNLQSPHEQWRRVRLRRMLQVAGGVLETIILQRHNGHGVVDPWIVGGILLGLCELFLRFFIVADFQQRIVAFLRCAASPLQTAWITDRTCQRFGPPMATLPGNPPLPMPYIPERSCAWSGVECNRSHSCVPS